MRWRRQLLVLYPVPPTDPPAPGDGAHADIARLVATFYARARHDPLLGPVFAQQVADWPHHLAALTAFWAVQLRGAGRYRGMPLAAHRPLLPDLSPAMFARWLALWRQAATEMTSKADAAILIAKAENLANRMSKALFPNAEHRP